MDTAVEYIDDALRDTSLRTMFSQDEVQGILLDLRWIICPTPEESDGTQDSPENEG